MKPKKKTTDKSKDNIVELVFGDNTITFDKTTGDVLLNGKVIDEDVEIDQHGNVNKCKDTKCKFTTMNTSDSNEEHEEYIVASF